MRCDECFKYPFCDDIDEEHLENICEEFKKAKRKQKKLVDKDKLIYKFEDI